ncbi:hypothetical protein K227x_64170 [Rubripirellula lacrimiformis]|uniref:Uncharacterized protein n=1 Tax=Rubripirellula lacrimiformis TaxID=1930273 RepID=A0A517NLH0_9BACT|nr:hypothetical protein [Rubripirellula lacrimiformis]QDT07987.1 hypothetical protein K227x_64170 [Rubripirellula lacrimiformis]
MGDRASRCCQGCELFAIANVLDSEAEGVSTIGGYRVVGKVLPAAGDYAIEIDVTFDGQVPAVYELAFQLIDATDTPVMTWTHKLKEFAFDYDAQSITYVPTVGYWARDTISDLETGVTYPDGQRLVFDRIVMRAVSGTFERRIEDIGGTEPWHIETGFPIGFDGTDLAELGPLRVGVKMVTGWSGSESDLSVNVTGYKTLVEAIAGDEEEYYCDPQAGKNPTCDSPTVCPVTWPSYATPRWAESSIGITGFTFSSTTPHQRLFQECASSWTRAQQPVWPSEIYGPVPPNHEDMSYVESYHAFNFEPGPSPVFDRVADDTFLYPTGIGYSAGATVMATDDPCLWKVRALLQMQILQGPDYPVTLPYRTDTGKANLVANYDGVGLGTVTVWFEKTVPRWSGAPPTVSFGSADVIDPVSFDRVTSYSVDMVEVSPGVWRMIGDGTKETHSTAGISLTIAAETLTGIPHP